jgi:hypothetical protein
MRRRPGVYDIAATAVGGTDVVAVSCAAGNGCMTHLDVCLMQVNRRPGGCCVFYAATAA